MARLNGITTKYRINWSHQKKSKSFQVMILWSIRSDTPNPLPPTHIHMLLITQTTAKQLIYPGTLWRFLIFSLIVSF